MCLWFMVKSLRFTAGEDGINIYTTSFVLENKVKICDVVPFFQMVENSACNSKIVGSISKSTCPLENAL